MLLTGRWRQLEKLQLLLLMLRRVSQRRFGLEKVYKCHPGVMRLRVFALMLCSHVEPLELPVRGQQMAR